MDNYVTGAVIRRLRERRKMTQEELAERIHVSGKAVSKWETGQGFPDISLLEPLSAALDISVIELLSGEDVRNSNRSSDMRRGRFYVCPVCGNVIRTVGEALVSCCGITLPPLTFRNNLISSSSKFLRIFSTVQILRKNSARRFPFLTTVSLMELRCV